MQLFRFVVGGAAIGLFLAAAAVALPHQALAGGTSKSCGSTTPEGPYKDSCEGYYWRGGTGFIAKCLTNDHQKKDTTLSCEQIKECGWKLANNNGKLECE